MRILIAVALSIALTGCASTMKVNTAPVTLNVIKPSQPRPVVLGNVKWMVVTKNNIEVFLAEQAKIQGNSNPVFIAISPDDYKKISVNLAELKRYISQQKAIIVYYENAVTPSK